MILLETPIVLPEHSILIDYGLWFAYALIALAVLGMVLGIVIAIFQNMKEGGLIAIVSGVALVVLFVIGYSMSSSVVPDALASNNNVDITASGYQLSSGGLITFYIMVVVAFILMVVGLVKGVFQGN